MRRYQLVATVWSALNFGLATRMPVEGSFPWLPVAGLALLPLFLLFCAGQIAGSLHRGFIERYASDRHQPQSPVVVMLMGWIVLVLQTGFVISRLL